MNYLKENLNRFYEGDIDTFYPSRQEGHLPLSNFWIGTFTDRDNDEWHSGEAFFQSRKTINMDEREAIRAAPTPGQAKKLGRSVTLRPGWEEFKLYYMQETLYLKFFPGTFEADFLLRTHGKLTEGNTWGDRFWGVDGTGDNWLGVLLMLQRSRLHLITGGFISK